MPIGRPIANIRIHLLDAHLQPVPVGVPGELFIGGVGVGRGYLNRPDATAAKFIADPFTDEPGQMLYRTGDLARYLPDGNIEYLGRLDDQVKIRGVRIEPREVEAALDKHPAVRQNAVVAGSDIHGNIRLVAHLVAGGETAPSTAELRRFLLERLPSAMVPALFRVTDALPLMPSGKVDRRALRAADEAPSVQEPTFVAPRTRTELLLTEIWREVLGVERVGIFDDFFALGGASTHSMEVAVRAKAAGLPLTPESLFLHGTIAGLAAQYDEAAEELPHLERQSNKRERQAGDRHGRGRPRCTRPFGTGACDEPRDAKYGDRKSRHISARGGGVDRHGPRRMRQRNRHSVGTPDRYQTPARGWPRRVLHRPCPAGGR